jgi:hypothetical protein
VKIWSVVWKCDLNWIFVWNMLHVWKYDHLCEKLTFIVYLCQCLIIWSFVWKFYFHWIFLWNMLNVWKYGCFWSVCSFLKSCVQFLVKCVLSGEAKGRHTYRTHVSHLSKGDVPTERVSHILINGDTRCGGTSPFYLICTKKVRPINYSPRECFLRQHTGCPLV